MTFVRSGEGESPLKDISASTTADASLVELTGEALSPLS